MCALMLLAPWTHAHAEGQPDAQYCALLPALEADGERANASVAWQVGLGPRLPGSNASAVLLDGFEENHSAWSFTRDTHTYAGGTLTNLVAVYPPNADLATTDALGLGAHYDSREFADFEENATNASLPVPGANDGGSGVGAVGELMRIIPSMNLEHAVVVVLFDAEDQGTYTDKESWAEGSRRWADNLTEEEVSHLKAFILLDMIGDADLNLANISSNDETLNDAIGPLAQALGLIEGREACTGVEVRDIYQPGTSVDIMDDHVRLNNVGVPAVDLIDHRYGPNATGFANSHWHTLEDTPDKVSADALETVMHLVELGLRSGAWMDAVNAEGDLNDGPSGEEDFQPTLDEARDFAGPIGWLVLGWIFVLGLAGCSIVAILALRKLRPPSAARTWSWDEA
ncbi:MAG: M28 family peptidase [Candidatus Thermoplasmatota archaeon]|nr:M28 family peptidase [Candidatus Thermoplasmatota archaeon]